MSRPIKSGLDYFPLDVNMDESMELIEVDYSLEGFAIIIKLYQRIYKNSYYIDVSEKGIKLLSRYINTDVDLLKEVIKAAIEYKIFNNKLYKKYKILTSSGIQKRYLMATERRLNINVCKEYFLLDINVYINSVNVTINSINDAETGVNEDISTQSKVNKKERKEDIKEKYGEYNHVLLTGKQYEQLKTEVDDREKWIKTIDESIEEKGNVYRIKNFKLAAVKWYKRDQEKQPKKNSNTSGVFVDDSSPIKDIIHQEYKELYK
jgi:hypothetical protein